MAGPALEGWVERSVHDGLVVHAQHLHQWTHTLSPMCGWHGVANSTASWKRGRRLVAHTANRPTPALRRWNQARQASALSKAR